MRWELRRELRLCIRARGEVHGVQVVGARAKGESARVVSVARAKSGCGSSGEVGKDV